MGNMLSRQTMEFSMNDPANKSEEDDQAETLSGSNDKIEDTGTTIRRKTLKLEGELWPDGETVDPEEDDGVDPYNTGRFDTGKR